MKGEKAFPTNGKYLRMTLKWLGYPALNGVYLGLPYFILNTMMY